MQTNSFFTLGSEGWQHTQTGLHVHREKIIRATHSTACKKRMWLQTIWCDDLYLQFLSASFVIAQCESTYDDGVDRYCCTKQINEK